MRARLVRLDSTKRTRRKLGDALGCVGTALGARPVLSVVVTASALAALSAGLVTAELHDAFLDAWVPEGARALQERRLFESLFHDDPLARVARLVVTPRPPLRDVLAPEPLAEAAALVGAVERLRTDPGNHSLASLCGRPFEGSGECFALSVLGYWGGAAPPPNRTAAELKRDVAAGLLFSAGVPVEQERVLGCIERDAGGGAVQSAGALSFTWFLDGRREREVREFEHDFLDLVERADLPHVVADAYADVSLERELREQQRSASDIGLVAASYVTIFLFVALVNSDGAPPSRSRVLLALGGVVLIALTLCATLGVVSAFGLRLTPLDLQALPLLLVAVGVDDMFIVSAAFADEVRRDDGAVGGRDALRRCLRCAGPSVVLTSLTSTAALATATIIDVPATRTFCIVAAVGVALSLVSCLAAYAPLVLLDHERAVGGRADCVPCVRGVSTVTGGGSKRPFARVLVTHWYAPLLRRRCTQLAAILGYVALLAAGIHQIVAKLEIGLEPSSLTVSGSSLDRYLHVERRCNADIGPSLYLVVYGDLDYVDLRVSGPIDDAVAELEASAITDPPVVYSWLRAFHNQFVPYFAPTGCVPNCTRSESLELIGSFTDSIVGESYRGDLALSNVTGVDASRVRTRHVPLPDVRSTLDAIRAARAVAERLDGRLRPLGGRAFVYSNSYVFYEQFFSARRDYLVAVCTASAVVSLLVSLVAGIRVGVAVALGLLSVQLLLLGALPLLGLRLNALTNVMIVAVIGLSDEYIEHIAFGIVSLGEADEHLTVYDRVAESLSTYIQPVSNAAASTVLGLLPLAFTQSPVLREITFRILVAAVPIAWVHGVVLLPALALAASGWRAPS